MTEFMMAMTVVGFFVILGVIGAAIALGIAAIYFKVRYWMKKD